MSDTVREILPAENGVTLYVGLGNSLRGDDFAGSLLITMIEPRDGIVLFDAGEKTETAYDKALEIKPVKAVFFDAADMRLPSGTVQIVYEDTLSMSAVSTHKVPLPLITKLIREETGAEIVICGIQPASVEFMHKMDESVKESCETLAKIINNSR
ncbi:hydrogenase maturation protease [Seleniivibrio sp.]|uniref:hydrogenase maturation protease n=1 Tax=Seleniivibrio sp. TaxID=2898801 RepID=UPI0025D96B6D|nr:hydrogenase maturation protease [Seleniivibrio sp.]MCD8553768.1 hydrogenase maturation protease [Seleniivibrio sp.]